MTKAKTKIEPRLSKDERMELTAIEARMLDTYIGYNVNRYFFAEKKDAERFLELQIKDGADKPIFYGSECEFGVTSSNWKGKENPCWEVAIN